MPFIWNPKLPKRSGCHPSKGICRQDLRESEFDSAVVENLPRHQRGQPLDVLPHRVAVLGRKMQE